MTAALASSATTQGRMAMVSTFAVTVTALGSEHDVAPVPTTVTSQPPAGAEGERRRDRARSPHAARTAEEEVEHARREAATAALAGTGGARAVGGHPPRL